MRISRVWSIGLLASLLLGISVMPTSVLAEEDTLHEQASVKQIIKGDFSSFLFGPHFAENTEKTVSVAILAAQFKGK